MTVDGEAGVTGGCDRDAHGDGAGVGEAEDVGGGDRIAGFGVVAVVCEEDYIVATDVLVEPLKLMELEEASREGASELESFA